jgi:hypothetical protein
MEPPLAAVSCLAEQVVRATYAVRQLLRVVTLADPDRRDSLREDMHLQLDRRLPDMRP